MKCLRCQAENDAGARFCEDCGAKIPLHMIDGWRKIATVLSQHTAVAA